MGPSLLCRRLNVSMIGLNQDKQKAISQKVEDIKVWDKYYI